MPNKDHESSVGFLVSDVARLLRRNFNRRAQELGLSQAQWRALAYLSLEEGVNQVTLADRLEIQPITLVRLIDHLQEAGLVARRPDPDDRRAQRLYLTPAAEPVLERMWALAAESRAEVLASFTPAEQATLIDLLKRMKGRLLDLDARAVEAEPKFQKGKKNVAGNA